jgi:subtilisin family serine protease
MKPEIVAQFAPDVDVADYIEEFGLEVEAEKRSSRGKAGEVVARNYVLSLEADGADYVRLIQAANALYERGRQDGRVNHAHPNFVPIRRKQQLDEIEDPRFGNQWHLHNDGSSGGVEDADIDAPEAWRLTTGRPEVRVAIIDDSVERDHPDLPDGFLGRYYGGLGEGEEDDPSPRTYRQRHGTACAGVAVGVGNDQGIRGSAPDCGLIGVHFWDADLAQTAEAFRFSADPDDDPATDDGAAVISCSWSWNAAFDAVRDAVVEVATTARGGRGAVVLFAAGNGDRETLMALPIESQQFFGSLDEVICVGATNWRDDHCTYSNFGPELDVVAPSNDPLRVGALSIDTTDNTQDAPRHPVTDIAGYASGDYTGNGATGFGGTSSATPTTAGVCGLLLTVNPELTAAQVRSILEHTTDRVRGNLRKATYDPTTGHDPYYGFGRINAKNAVLTARDSLTNPHSTWPDRVADLAATRENGSIVRVEWVNPAADVSGVLVVRGPEPIRWRPHDGERYVVGDEVGGDAVVVAVGATESFEDDSGVRPSHFAIYAYNGDRLYSWGRMVESPF